MGGTTGLVITRVSDCEVSLDESQITAKSILKWLQIWNVFPEQPSSWAGSVNGSEGMVSLKYRNLETETDPIVPVDESSIYWCQHASKNWTMGWR